MSSSLVSMCCCVREPGSPRSRRMSECVDVTFRFDVNFHQKLNFHRIPNCSRIYSKSVALRSGSPSGTRRRLPRHEIADEYKLSYPVRAPGMMMLYMPYRSDLILVQRGFNEFSWRAKEEGGELRQPQCKYCICSKNFCSHMSHLGNLDQGKRVNERRYAMTYLAGEQVIPISNPFMADEGW